MESRVKRFSPSGPFYESAAELFADTAQKAVERRGRFVVALSGGNTPRRLYEILAAEPYRRSVPWDKTVFFWGDERCVGPDSPDSNYGMAEKALLRHIPLNVDHVHRMRGEEKPRLEAERYCAVLEEMSAGVPTASDTVFDLVLLGIGNDGHTASLFPDSPALKSTLWACATHAPAGTTTRRRITLTLTAFERAEKVLFLATGPEKRSILNRVLDEHGRPCGDLPAALVRPRQELLWYIADTPV